MTSAQGRPRRRRRIVAGLAALTTVVAGAAAVALTRSSAADAAGGAPASGLTTAAVERRDLVVTETLTGELAYADVKTVTSARKGTVTTVAAAGTTVAVGSALFSIDLEPAVVLRGEIPAFRVLDTTAGDGPDVRQLEQALADLGYGDGLTVDEDFTSVTATAVTAWEKDLGRAEPDGVVELGDVIFTTGDLRVSAVLAAVGAQVQTGSDVVDTTSPAKVVDADLDADRSNDLETGTAVGLTLPGGTGTTGTVTNVGTQPETSSADPDAAPTVPVQITLDDPAAADAFDSGSVDVVLERSRENSVLAVPVTALMALAEGGYAVQVVDAAQPTGYRLVAVAVGTIAEGYVAVTGEAVREGVTVVVPA
jgi:peptidoglycan hydrolase-like protein with peptidoglycan-binding domain